MANKQTVLEKILHRNTHRRWIWEALHTHPLSSKSERARKHIYAWLEWCFAKIASGQRVRLYGIGTISGYLRKGRTITTRLQHRSEPVTIVHKPIYVLRLSPSLRMAKAMRRLAETNPDPKTVFKHECSNRNKSKGKKEPSKVAVPGGEPGGAVHVGPNKTVAGDLEREVAKKTDAERIQAD